ncbi:MAG: ABC transporter substrate-binding protein [Bacteroidetes bacterium]|nr:ABC transporter substrate-binding protein [Bacteroidota bacterium]
MKSHFWWSAIVLCCTITLFSCSNKTSKQGAGSQTEHYSIGVNLPLSGNAAYFGSELYKGLALSFAEAEKQYGCRFEILAEDNRFLPQEAVGIAKKFIHIAKPNVIVSGYSNVLQATIPLVEESGIPMIASLSSVADIAKNKQWVIRDFSLESQLMPMLAEYVFHTANLKTGSFLVVNDDFGQDSRNYFTQAFETLGGHITEGAVYCEDDLDFRNLVQKILVNKPQFMLVIGRGAGMANAIRRIREADPNVLICGSSSFDNDKIMASLGHDAENLVFTNFHCNTSSQAYLSANNLFTERYQQGMNWVNVLGYTIGEYTAEALVKCKGDGNKIMDYLRSNEFNTIRGKLTVNGNNDMLSGLSVFIRENAKNIEIVNN